MVRSHAGLRQVIWAMVWLYASQACGGQLRVAPPGGQVRTEHHLCTPFASVKALKGCCREGTVESALVTRYLETVPPAQHADLGLGRTRAVCSAVLRNPAFCSLAICGTCQRIA